MRFWKGEALGNDYLVVDGTAGGAPSAERIRALCDRHGIPLWLFQKHNPELDINNLKLGEKVLIPVIRKSSVASRE